jgi:hypothetical protein
MDARLFTAVPLTGGLRRRLVDALSLAARTDRVEIFGIQFHPHIMGLGMSHRKN